MLLFQGKPNLLIVKTVLAHYGHIHGVSTNEKISYCPYLLSTFSKLQT